MESTGIWVFILTNPDRFDNPDRPTESEIQDVLRNPENYGIADFRPEGEIEDIVLKPGIR